MAPRHPLFAFLQPGPVPRAASDRHLEPDEAEVLLAYLPARGQEWLAHWAGCSACQEALRLHFAARTAAPAAVPAKRERIEALEMVTAAVQDAGRRLDEELEQADAHAAALLATPAARRRGRIRAEARFRTLGVACRLIHRGLFAESPKGAESSARLAIAVVAALDPGDVMSLAAGETKAKAWALIANARWQRGDVAATLRALDEAERALVEDGALRDHRAFRRATRLLRLVERHLGNAVVAAGGAVGQLLGSLWSQLPEDAPPTEDGSTRPAAARGAGTPGRGEDLEN